MMGTQESLGDQSLHASLDKSMQLQAQHDSRSECLMFILGRRLCVSSYRRFVLQNQQDN